MPSDKTFPAPALRPVTLDCVLFDNGAEATHNAALLQSRKWRIGFMNCLAPPTDAGRPIVATLCLVPVAHEDWSDDITTAIYVSVQRVVTMMFAPEGGQ